MATLYMRMMDDNGLPAGGLYRDIPDPPPARGAHLTGFWINATPTRVTDVSEDGLVTVDVRGRMHNLEEYEAKGWRRDR
jgi:hypothetical protein